MLFRSYFVFVGAVHPRKNVHRLIEAFDLFKNQTNSTLKLVIVGRFGWQTGDVKAAFDNAATQKDIIFTGYVSNEDVPQLVGSAVAVTYVSLVEGFGIPILEGFACDVPVLTSNVTSMPEIAADAALLVDPTSITDIAKGLQDIAFNAVLRGKLIQNAQKRRLDFNWDKTAEVVYETLKSAAN